MATTIDAVLTTEFDNRFSENVLNRNLTFYKDFTANVVSGTGFANTSADFYFSNKKSLYVSNLSTTTTLVVDAPSGEWLTDLTTAMINQKAIFQFSLLNNSGVVLTGRFNIYSNGVFMYVLEFESAIDGGFRTYYQNLIAPAGDFEFSIELDSNPATTECYISGIKLEYDQDELYSPTPYSTYVETTYEATETIDVPSIPSNDYETVVATLTGAELGDFVQMTYPAELITLGLVVGYPIVTDVDEISFVVHNHSGGAINPASGTYTFKIVK